jgi:hypothetical protein
MGQQFNRKSALKAPEKVVEKAGRAWNSRLTTKTNADNC